MRKHIRSIGLAVFALGLLAAASRPAYAGSLVLSVNDAVSKTTDQEFLYQYTVTNQGQSTDLEAFSFLLNVAPDSSLSAISGPPGWDLTYSSGDPVVSWDSPSPVFDLLPGATVQYSFLSPLGPGPQDFIALGSDATATVFGDAQGTVLGPSAVPEPSTLTLSLLGLFVLGALHLRLPRPLSGILKAHTGRFLAPLLLFTGTTFGSPDLARAALAADPSSVSSGDRSPVADGARVVGPDRVKRLLDVAIASIALIVLAPVFAVIAWRVRRDGGPALFRQLRVGKDGRLFWFYKFRSMAVGAETLHASLAGQNDHGPDGVTFKARHDPRVTPVGRILRQTSLDELPQLINVLKGEMSLVGPRPALPSEVARHTAEQRRRLAVLPGMTCFWQVSGRAELPFEQQVRLDLEYIARRSLWLDLTLLLRTIPAVVKGRGAY
jgi:lipopolysaccharide/colanic/teichoic acid biosynthesis glycosyltransferase